MAKVQAHHNATCGTEVVVKVNSGHGLAVERPETLTVSKVMTNPIGYALFALGFCQAITYRIWAGRLGVKLDKVEIEIDWDIDLGGLLCLRDSIRSGSKTLHIRVNLRGPESGSRYEELAAAVDAHCPVLALLRNSVRVERELASSPSAPTLISGHSAKPVPPPGTTRLRTRERRIAPDHEPRVLVVGDLQLNPQNRRVFRAGRDLNLGSTEFRLLECLMRRPGNVFLRSQLRDWVCGLGAEVSERAIDVYIGRLRKSLITGVERDPIRTVRGVGYSFDETYGRGW